MEDRFAIVPLTANRSQTSEHLSERIKSVDIQRPDDLARLAAEVKDYMQDIDEVEPQIREMLLRRQRAAAKEPSLDLPQTPKLNVKESGKKEPKVRYCCCGCGAKLLCGSNEDAAMTEMCASTLTNASCSHPPVDASHQRAYCAELAKPRMPSSASADDPAVTLLRPVRPPNYERLRRMAKPREIPPPPPPLDNMPKALPAPNFARLQPKRLEKVKSSFSAPSLEAILIDDDDGSLSPPLRGRREHKPLRSPTLLASSSGDLNSQFAKLQRESLLSKRSLAPASPTGNCSLPPIGSSFPSFGSCEYEEDRKSGWMAEKKRQISAVAQRRYTEEHLCPRSQAKSGSTAALQARLDALRRENQALREERLRTEATAKPWPRFKHLQRAEPPPVSALMM